VQTGVSNVMGWALPIWRGRCTPLAFAQMATAIRASSYFCPKVHPSIHAAAIARQSELLFRSADGNEALNA
jgi:hypothetical protein